MTQTKNNPDISINQVKILRKITDNNITSFGAGDFGTDLESFQPVADAIDDLIERGMMTAGEWHRESRSTRRRRDRILKCRITERGNDEMDKVTGGWLNSAGEFSLDDWS